MSYFNSQTAFDKHRTGSYGGGRRCRTTKEMEDLGMFINVEGFWVSEANARIYKEGEINES